MMSATSQMMDASFHPYNERHCVEVMKLLNNDRKAKKSCDAVLQVENKDYAVHKSVLYVISEFFKEIFEKDDNCKEVLEISVISADVLETSLDFMYTGFVSVTADNVCDLLKGADYLKIDGLKTICKDFLVQSISVDNCLEFQAIALRYNLTELLDETDRVVGENSFSTNYKDPQNSNDESLSINTGENKNQRSSRFVIKDPNTLEDVTRNVQIPGRLTESSSSPLESQKASQIKLAQAKNAAQLSAEVATVAAESPSQNIETQNFLKKFRSILSEISEQNFQPLMKEFQLLEINNEEQLESVVDLIFETAINDPNHSEVFANVCRTMSQFCVMAPIASQSDGERTVQFRKVLLTRCQREFEKDSINEEFLARYRQRLTEATTPERKIQIQVELQLAEATERQRKLGNTRFIGELFKLSMLSKSIMHNCIMCLFKARDEDSLENLCCLLTTVGKDLDDEKAQRRMTQYFQVIEKILSENKTSSAIRFLLQDVVNLRKNGWVPHENQDVLDRNQETEQTTLRVTAANTSLQTEKLLKKVRSILTEIIPQNFQPLMEEFQLLEINNEEQLESVVDLIFETAIDDPNRSEVFANLCQIMSQSTASPSGRERTVEFRKVLLTRCQREFEKDSINKESFARNRQRLTEDTTPERKIQIQVELQLAAATEWRRKLGNIRFIGELFKLSMLTESIMHNCIMSLFKASDEDALESLCCLLTTVGKDLDNERGQKRMTQYFQNIEKILSENKTSCAIRFLLKDVVNLRKNGWVPHEDLDVLDQNQETEQTTLRVTAASTSLQTEKLWEKVESILSKIECHDFHFLTFEFLSLELNSEEHLRRVVDLIHEKAMDEPTRAKTFAYLCQRMSQFLVTTPAASQSGEQSCTVNFRRLLLTRCQKKFEEDRIKEVFLLKLRQRLAEVAMPGKQLQFQKVLQLAEAVERRRMLGNTRFIGELLKLNVLPGSIMHKCIMTFLKAQSEESLENLCCFLTAIGKYLDDGNGQQRMSEYFQRIEEFINERKMSFRIRTLLQDVVALRKNNWVPHADQGIFYQWQKTELTTLRVTAANTSLQTQDFLRKVETMLGNIGRHNFSSWNIEFQSLDINSGERLKRVVNLIHEKAIEEPNRSEVFANLCGAMFHLCVKTSDASESGASSFFANFHKLLATRCQQEFENYLSTEVLLSILGQRLTEATTLDEKLQILEDVQSEEVETRRRVLGNTRFIAKLFKLNMLPESIIHNCIMALFKARDEDALENLCCLLTTVGKDLDHGKAQSRMSLYFRMMKMIIVEKKTLSRVRLLLEDLVELRKNRWVPFAIRDKRSKSVEQVPVGAKREEQSSFLVPAVARDVSSQNQSVHATSVLSRDEKQYKKFISTESAIVHELDSAKMKAKSKSILEEYMHLVSVKEASESYMELGAPDSLAHVFVREAMQGSLEKTSSDRRNIANLLLDFLRNDRISVDQYMKGVVPVVDEAEDLELDLPKVWSCLAELIVPVLASTGTGIDINHLPKFVGQLLEMDKANVFVVEILKGMIEFLDFETVLALWTTSDLRWSMFDRSDSSERSAFLCGHVRRSYNNFYSLLTRVVARIPTLRGPLTMWLDFNLQAFDNIRKDHDEDQFKKFVSDIGKQLDVAVACADDHIDWVKRSYDQRQLTSDIFVRALAVAVCRKAIIQGERSMEVDRNMIKQHSLLLLKYIDNGAKELQAVYALQKFYLELEQPPNILRLLFDYLYDEDIVSEQTFFKWEKSDDPSEFNGKGVALLSVHPFFNWLRDAESESDE